MESSVCCVETQINRELIQYAGRSFLTDVTIAFLSVAVANARTRATSACAPAMTCPRARTYIAAARTQRRMTSSHPRIATETKPTSLSRHRDHVHHGPAAPLREVLSSGFRRRARAFPPAKARVILRRFCHEQASRRKAFDLYQSGAGSLSLESFLGFGINCKWSTNGATSTACSPIWARRSE